MSLTCILDEEVYKVQPPGFIAQGECAKKIYRLKKSLSSLKHLQEPGLCALH